MWESERYYLESFLNRLVRVRLNHPCPIRHQKGIRWSELRKWHWEKGQLHWFIECSLWGAHILHTKRHKENFKLRGDEPYIVTPTRKTDAYKLKNTNGKDLMDFDRFELKRYHGPLMFKTCYPLNNTGRISYHKIPFTKDRGKRNRNRTQPK